MVFATLVLSLAGAFTATSFPEDAALAILAHQYAAGGNEYVHCLAVDGTDAPASLLAGLGRAGSEWVVASECVKDMQGSYRRSDKHPAVLVYLSEFRAASAAAASAVVADYVAAQGASSSRVYLRKVDGAWRVDRVELDFIAAAGM